MQRSGWLRFLYGLTVVLAVLCVAGAAVLGGLPGRPQDACGIRTIGTLALLHQLLRVADKSLFESFEQAMQPADLCLLLVLLCLHRLALHERLQRLARLPHFIGTRIVYCRYQHSLR